MPHRRILSIWFPRLGAERILRQHRGTIDVPFAVVEDMGNTQVLSSISALAADAGVTTGQPLRDAQAICPALMTRLRNAQAETEFLASLRRWAGKFSPWVASEADAGLIIDLTGCAHLFGGEEPLLAQVEQDCADLKLTVQCGIADTLGAAWALTRYAGLQAGSDRSGNAIDQEARATRSRAAKRRNWERGGSAPKVVTPFGTPMRIAPPGQMHGVLAPLPIGALLLDDKTVTGLARLGLRTIGDLTHQPRAPLARRFGRHLMQRLDQALGVDPEPVSPAKPPLHFACRLTLPDPIGLTDDILAAIDRILPRLQQALQAKVHGARRVRMQCYRSDQTMQSVEVGLARPSANPDRIRPLLMMKLDDIDAGFGIDMIRIQATVTEPVYATQHKGHAEASAYATRRLTQDTAIDDLIGRLGARIGLEQITREHPADSHIPEKASTTHAAAWSEPVTDWADVKRPRPVTYWRPEPVTAPENPVPPDRFKWRNRHLELATASGPERIAPEWWLDDPDWRSGVRDYWRVRVKTGEELWLYYAHGGGLSAGWFCHGIFA